MLQIFVRAVFASIRRRAGIPVSNRRARCGAVTFIQRFSDALNLDPHFHTLALDGIYVEGGRGGLVFRHVLRPVMLKSLESRTAFAGVSRGSWNAAAWGRRRIPTRPIR